LPHNCALSLEEQQLSKKFSEKRALMMLESRDHSLCERLLDEIVDNVHSFKPSKSLELLSLMRELDDEPNSDVIKELDTDKEVDIVISGGGLKGYFVTGCSYILKKEFQKRGMRIGRVSGASAGAWAGMLLVTEMSAANWIETYYKCQERYPLTIHDVYEEIWPWMQGIMPENAYLMCSGKLFISITEVTMWGLKNHIISEFLSNYDLFLACMASSSIPFLTECTSSIFRTFRGMWVMDGGLTNNTPYFQDGLRRQLAFHLSDVDYPIRLIVAPRDPCIEALVLRGAVMMSKFLQGKEVDNREIAWVEKKDSQKLKASKVHKVDIICSELSAEKRYYMHMVITPLVMLSTTWLFAHRASVV
jgi:hypothetical protein